MKQVTPTTMSEQEAHWRALHEERDRLIRMLDEERDRHDREFRSLARQENLPSPDISDGEDEERTYASLRHVESEIAAISAERHYQDTLARAAENTRRHTETAYTAPLPRIIDGYLADARSCPNCAMPPGRLRWTHQIHIHYGSHGAFTVSGWVTACPDCDAEVETIGEFVG